MEKKNMFLQKVQRAKGANNCIPCSNSSKDTEHFNIIGAHIHSHLGSLLFHYSYIHWSYSACIISIPTIPRPIYMCIYIYNMYI